jgi:hypothetical protein
VDEGQRALVVCIRKLTAFGYRPHRDAEGLDYSRLFKDVIMRDIGRQGEPPKMMPYRVWVN